MWTKYELGYKETDSVPVVPFKDGTVVCAYGSPFDETHPTAKKLYYDLVQEEVGLDSVYGVKREGTLSEDWNGHKAGSQVLIVYYRYDLKSGPDSFSDVLMIETLP